jgi:UDP-4-amino-4-deoxy-L-arabinose-oxoglutarate aminotransferase
MTDISAVLGLEQLGRLDGFIEKRTLLANHYLKGLSDIHEILPLSVPPWTSRHAWHLFIVRLNTNESGINRDQFMEELKRKNIGTGLHFRAVHEQQFYRKTFDISQGSLPETEWNSTRICSLPLFPGMTLDDVDYVVAAIKEVLA